MKLSVITLVAGALGSSACAVSTAGSGSPTDQTAPASTAETPVSVTRAATPSARVTVQGHVVGLDSAGIAGASAFWLPADPYLTSIAMTHTDASGSFTLSGVPGDTRAWLSFTLDGYAPVFQAFDTTPGTSQTLSDVTMMTQPAADAVASFYGTTLDSTRSVLKIPVFYADGSPAEAASFQVSFQPALTVPLFTSDGEAIALNVIAYDSYRVTVTRGGHPCVPAAHPELTAGDGSVEVRLMPACWTVGPRMICDR